MCMASACGLQPTRWIRDLSLTSRLSRWDFQAPDMHHTQATACCTWQSSMAYLNRTISKW